MKIYAKSINDVHWPIGCMLILTSLTWIDDPKGALLEEKGSSSLYTWGSHGDGVASKWSSSWRGRQLRAATSAGIKRWQLEFSIDSVP